MLPLIPHLMIKPLVHLVHKSSSSFTPPCIPYRSILRTNIARIHSPLDYCILNFNSTKRGISSPTSNRQHPVTATAVIATLLSHSPRDPQIKVCHDDPSPPAVSQPQQGPKSWNASTCDISATHSSYYKYYINTPNRNGIIKLG
jgi:hypothetical protein